MATGQEAFSLEGHHGRVRCVEITTDGRYAISASDDKTLKVWDLVTRQLVHTLVGHKTLNIRLTVTRDGRYAVSGDNGNFLKVWDLETGQGTLEINLHLFDGVGLKSIAIAEDGRYALVGTHDGGLRLWDIHSGQEIRRLAGRHPHYMPGEERGRQTDLTSVAVCNDGRYAVTTSFDHTVKIWDLLSGDEVDSLAGHHDAIRSVVLTADSRHAFSCSDDGTIKIWDLATRELVRTLTGHNDSVNAVALTADDRYVISASEDNTLRVWDSASGSPYCVFYAEAPVTWCAAATDGLLVCGDIAGRVYFLQLEGIQALSR